MAEQGEDQFSPKTAKIVPNKLSSLSEDGLLQLQQKFKDKDLKNKNQLPKKEPKKPNELQKTIEVISSWVYALGQKSQEVSKKGAKEVKKAAGKATKEAQE